MKPSLLTFDIFGTVLDWRAGLGDRDFDRLVDVQGELEQGRFRPYAEIVAESLVRVRRIDVVSAARMGAEVGTWPLFPDSREALRRMQHTAKLAATTNSDRAHGEQVQAQLGFRFDAWICAEEVRAYKPDRRIWEAASRKLDHLKRVRLLWQHPAGHDQIRPVDVGVLQLLGIPVDQTTMPRRR